MVNLIKLNIFKTLIAKWYCRILSEYMSGFAMAVGWEPKWVRRKFKMGEGIEIETCVDISTGLIVCPLCINVLKLCPSYTEPTPGALTSNALLFFNADDMFFHIKAHAKAGEWKPYEVGEEEEELEAEEEGVEEELGEG